jgi:hypothetical protein
MDFVWYFAAALLGAFLLFLIPTLKIRARKRRVTVEAIADQLGQSKDDLNEPARWVP